MSMFFRPEVEKPAPVKEVELKQIQARGRTGRTILAGANQATSSNRKTILGG